MGVKRRTIWMRDEEWAELKATAQRYGLTPSAFIALVADETRRMPMPAEQPAERNRAAFGRHEDDMVRIGAVRFNSQPFAGPIPKKGK